MDTIRPPLEVYDSRRQTGFPSAAEEFAKPALTPNTYLLRNPVSTFYRRVKGNAFASAGILDGDVLVIDKSREYALGQLVLVERDGGFTVRYLGNGKLLPVDPAGQAIELDQEQQALVVGVVAGVMRRL